MRVLVCGTRSAAYSGRLAFVMRARLQRLAERGFDTLIHGDCEGMDRHAAVEAGSILGWKVLAFPADWSKHGKAAGPIRNRQMLEEGSPHLVLAFHTDPGLGRGTADMVRAAHAAGVPVEIHLRADGGR